MGQTQPNVVGVTLCGPQDVFVSNGEVFVCDSDNHRVRKLLRNGQFVTICGKGVGGYNGDDKSATEAYLKHPIAVVVSSSNQVYISEYYGNRIRKIGTNGIISTIAGTGARGYNGDDGLATSNKLYAPHGLFVTDEEEVLIADCYNHCIRKVNQNGIITTIAGRFEKYEGGFNGDNQLANSARLNSPTDVFKYKNEIYICDCYNHRIRKIDTNGMIITIAGTGERGYNGDGILATIANLNFPRSVFIHNDQIYISDSQNNRIRKILPNGIIKTIAGNGLCGYNGDEQLAIHAKLCSPTGIFVDTDSQVYIADRDNHIIRKVDSNGMIRTVLGSGRKLGYSGDVLFDFEKYPHIGPQKKKQLDSLHFSKAYCDLEMFCEK